MKVNCFVNEENVITGYTEVPFDGSKPFIEIADGENIVLNCDKVIDGQFVKGDRESFCETGKKKNAILSEIAKLKQKLSETDYQAIKFAEGSMSESEFTPIRQKREEWRAEINKLETEVI